ncbi:thioredoxin family protein [Gaetbulibacter saemankumensis]|uniref:thioredoxin family protein n=1 Tax=Gaetbulibacter saemankumensis TaxID=311208 RepID=UPI0003FC8D5F|nr:DUF255 domain-containing protein [Gaetbulibacter saemankumensis]
MFKLTRVLALIFCLIFQLQNFAQTNFKKLSWEEVIQQAQTENKPIFIDLYFQGCKPCAEMDADVFPNETIAHILNNDFIAFKADIFKEDIGKKLSLKYGVNGFPTFIFLSPEGYVLNIEKGYQSVKELEELLLSAQHLKTKKAYKKFSNTLTGDYPAFYSKAYLENKRNFDYDHVIEYLENQDLTKEIPFIVITGLRVGGIYADFVIDNAEILANDYGQSLVKSYLISQVTRKAVALGKQNNVDKFNELLAKVKPVFTTEDWIKYKDIFQTKYATNQVK